MPDAETQGREPAQKPLVIAHRGFSSRYAENTMLAFEKAISAGADGIECDLRMTKDHEIVFFHDKDLRTLCGIKACVENSRWEDLQELKVHQKEPLARFEELRSRLPDIWINLEIKKSKRCMEIVEKLHEFFVREPPQKKIMISSFSSKILEHAHQLDWKHDKVLLSPIITRYGEKTYRKLRDEEWPYSWNCQFSGIAGFQKKKQHLSLPKPFWIWTANTRDEWELCLRSGLSIEALITDYPDRLRKFLNSQETPTKP